jgi:hypothetical protein
MSQRCRDSNFPSRTRCRHSRFLKQRTAAIGRKRSFGLMPVARWLRKTKRRPRPPNGGGIALPYSFVIYILVLWLYILNALLVCVAPLFTSVQTAERDPRRSPAEQGALPRGLRNKGKSVMKKSLGFVMSILVSVFVAAGLVASPAMAQDKAKDAKAAPAAKVEKGQSVTTVLAENDKVRAVSIPRQSRGL